MGKMKKRLQTMNKPIMMLRIIHRKVFQFLPELLGEIGFKTSNQ